MLAGRNLGYVATRQVFDLTSRDDWHAAIATGAVGIGSFIAPCFWSAADAIAVDLNNAQDVSPRFGWVMKEVYRVPPGAPRRNSLPFSSASRRRPRAPERTYRIREPRLTRRSSSRRRLIVHTDLDYFINDFNGTAGARRRTSPTNAWSTADDGSCIILRQCSPSASACRTLDRSSAIAGFCSAVTGRGCCRSWQNRLRAVTPVGGRPATGAGSVDR